ncbi:M15 family metallopeptidase [Microbacterium paraoxydans]
MKGAAAAVCGVICIPLIAIFVLIATSCSSLPGGKFPTIDYEVNIENLPVDEVGTWKGEQLVNAAIIMNAATELKLPVKAQVIGVMTAMGESSLINLNHDDDATNPDGSIADGGGLFQQQVSQGWGTWEEVTDPATASRTFLTRLAEVAGWESMEPSIAAHKVQGNDDPYHYEKFYEDAVDVVAALAEVNIDPGNGAEAAQCANPIGNNGNFPPGKNPPGQWGGFENGRIDESLLAPIPWAPNYTLRGDAVANLIAMNNAFRAEFGYDLPINDGYRDYAGQVEAKAIYGDEAAEPGTSNHGWALAIDVGDRSHYRLRFSHPIYLWLKANAPRYGWVHPDWAEPGGPGPDEAWHWEFWGIEETIPA